MNIALVDLPNRRSQLSPFSLTRPIGYFRVGILTITEKWGHYPNDLVDCVSSDVINKKFQQSSAPYGLAIDSATLPDKKLVEAVSNLSHGEALYHQGQWIAARGSFQQIPDGDMLDSFEKIELESAPNQINRLSDLFLKNGDQIKADYELLTKGQKSKKISDPHTIIYGEENLFVAEGVEVRAATLNAENGPIYLDRGSQVHEGAVIRGPFYLGPNSQVNINSIIREGTTIGPNSKIGGEVSNAVIFGNSNKAHGGFLGNSVIGEFCNLGAATNNSNLKNNYGEVKLWDGLVEDYVDTGLQFCGLMMGDHSKSAIGTTFNTGTVVGVAANIFGSGFPSKFVPSFTWGGIQSAEEYQFDKAVETAKMVMPRKGQEFTERDQDILREVFEQTKRHRK